MPRAAIRLIMLNVLVFCIMQCHNKAMMLIVVEPNVIMMSVFVPNAIMPSVKVKPIILSAISLY